jgi:ATP-binding cassette subfamily B (MDR/TAP) protein 1
VGSSKEETDQTLKKDIDSISFFQLFRFAEPLDKVLMAVGSLGAFVEGAAMPVFTILWGNMTDAFGGSTSDPDAAVNQSRDIMWNFLEIGLGVFVASWLMLGCWMIAGERQAIRCRKKYLAALLKQEVGWFDRVNQT